MLCSLTACSQLEQLMYSDEPLIHVERLVDKQQFEKALQFMENLPPIQRDRQVLKKRFRQLQLEAIAYEKQQIDLVQQLITKQDWVGALTLLNEALDHYERGVLLQQSHQKVSSLQQADLKKLWLDFNEQRAKPLIDLLAQVKHIRAAGDESSEAEEIEEFYLEQAELLSDYFAQQADLQVSKRSWWSALRYFRLADKLSLQPRFSKEISRLNRRLYRQQVPDKPVEKMLEEFQGQLDKGELLAAQASLDEIAETHKKANVEQQRQTLQVQIDKRVAELLVEGREHYAKGELDEAISLWRLGLILKPDEKELIDLLTRAEAFKSNYEKLRKAN